MGLTNEELHFYETNGYLLKKGLVCSEDIALILEEIDDIHNRMAEQPADGIGISWEVYDTEDHPPRIKQLMHSELVSSTLNRLLRCDEMLDILEALMGENISLYHSKLLPKAGGDGTAIPWHQDYAYWKNDTNRPVMINCQLAINDANLENGCIQSFREATIGVCRNMNGNNRRLAFFCPVTTKNGKMLWLSKWRREMVSFSTP